MITVDQILQYFPNKSYDPALLTARMPLVELIYIRKFLGADFYDELKGQYITDNLTAYNEYFLKTFLQPLLAQYCMYDSLAMLQAEPRSNGMEFTLPEFGQRADKADVGLTVNKILGSASALLEQAELYLREENANYPLYKCSKDLKNNYGIIFTDTNSQVYYDRNI